MDIGTSALLILFIASITSILAHRFKIAYAKLLVVMGVIVSVASHLLLKPTIEPTGEFIISVVLPPLIFQAALTMDYAVFKRVRNTVILLAVVSVAISAVICSFIVATLAGLSFIAALAFGVIISPTDAAAVVDTFKRVKTPKELTAIVEGESLLNDATALALFSAVSTLTLKPMASVFEIGKEFAGGAIVGLAIAYLGIRLLPLLKDKNAQVMISISMAYGSYALANGLGFSGIVAVAILGLYIGRYYQDAKLEESGNELMLHFWDVAAFIATAVAFVFIGLVADLSQLLQLAPLVMLCFVAALVARYLSTEMVLLPASRLTGSVSRTWRNTACLAGIRGAVSVALALSLPEFPFKGTIVAITFGVVLFSLLVQTELLSYYVGKAFR